MASALGAAYDDEHPPFTRAITLTTARRLLEATCAIGFAGAILAVGLSDIAVREQRPELALQLFGARAAAAADLAAARQAQGDTGAAVTLARQALGISFVHVAALRVMGQEEAASGHPSAATTLMTTAGLWGWRDAETQLWLVRDGLRTGDYAAVARRTDALLRLSVARPELFVLIRIVLGDPHLRVAFVARFASRPEWRSTFFQRVGDTPPAQYDNIDSLLRGLAGTAAPVTRSELAPYLRRLVAVGEVGRAHMLWQELAAASATTAWPSSAVLADPLPFDWILTLRPQSAVRVEGGQLVVDAAPEASGTVASRRLYLPLGSYDLSFITPRSTDPAVWRWQIRCPSGEGVRFAVVRVAELSRIRFARPACRAPLLELDLQDTDRLAAAELRMGPVTVTSAD